MHFWGFRVSGLCRGTGCLQVQGFSPNFQAPPKKIHAQSSRPESAAFLSNFHVFEPNIFSRRFSAYGGDHFAFLGWDPFDHSGGQFSLNVKKSAKKSRNRFPGLPAGGRLRG